MLEDLAIIAIAIVIIISITVVIVLVVIIIIIGAGDSTCSTVMTPLPQSIKHLAGGIFPSGDDVKRLGCTLFAPVPQKKYRLPNAPLTEDVITFISNCMQAS